MHPSSVESANFHYDDPCGLQRPLGLSHFILLVAQLYVYQSEKKNEHGGPYMITDIALDPVPSICITRGAGFLCVGVHVKCFGLESHVTIYFKVVYSTIYMVT
jgi:hypothetical protein